MSSNGTVVVGIDHSKSSDAALKWAVTAAARRHADLRIVHVCELPRTDLHTTGEVEASRETYARSTGQQLVDAAVQIARTSNPDVVVIGQLRVGSASEELLEESMTAQLLVVGNLGGGGFVGLLLGSTAMKLATHAHCAVVAVPTASRDERTSVGVTVGVESAQVRPAVLEFAFREASLLGEPLTAVHAWRPPKVIGAGRTMPEVFDEEWAETHESAELAIAIKEVAAAYPDVEVRQKTVAGHPAKVLIDEAQGSRLLVVGTRGRGEFRSIVLGSVSHAALHHAHRPVAVVPHTA